jgi:hypothetical protein
MDSVTGPVLTKTKWLTTGMPAPQTALSAGAPDALETGSFRLSGADRP